MKRNERKMETEMEMEMKMKRKGKLSDPSPFNNILN